MAIEIVDFPIKNGGSFHSFLYVYQRVCPFDHGGREWIQHFRLRFQVNGCKAELQSYITPYLSGLALAANVRH